MKSRNEIGKLFQSVYKTGIGCEIGVEQGINSERILKDWKGKLLCVDIWLNETFYNEAKERLNNERVNLIRLDSKTAAQTIENGSLDWVYIDDDHSYNGVKTSFYSWFEKVRVGGIVSGHDYGVNDCIGVKEFIDEYMIEHPEVEMNFTTDDFYIGERKDLQGLEYQTWWFIKK